MLYQDIPRIYTAIAEWGACLVYLYMLKREKMKSAHFLIGVLLMLALQCAFLVATGNVSEVLWIPCMIIAVAIMYVFLMVGGSMKPLGAGYCCARAFVLAEFVASLQWQIVSIVQVRGIQSFWTEILITIIVFGGCFVIDIYLERDFLKQDYLQQMTVKEVVAAAIMAVTIFAFSNLSFLSENVPFASKERADIFSMRTLIDFGGIAILHAYQSRISEYIAEKELSAMNVILKSQYDQYRNYQDSLDLIQMKYHDLKHQITALRAESDAEKRKKWIDAMEEEVSAFENMSKTGNQVLDTILAAKIFHCRKNHIQITCVADGKLLDFIHVTDLCSIFGNALDNAIEAAEKCEDGKGKITCIFRNINDMFIFKVKNTSIYKPYEKNTKFYTSKKEKDEHGWGIESVKQIVRKYNGEIDFKYDKDFFEVEIIISDNT